jgi:hypothetical protein
LGVGDELGAHFSLLGSATAWTWRARRAVGRALNSPSQ